MGARIYALCNQKGGVGKTSGTFYLGRAAVLAGHRVLLVDADPQGNLTTVAAPPETVEEDQVGLADALSARTEEELRDVIVPTVWDKADLVPTPSPEALGAVGQELVISGPGRERRLREALAAVSEDYDFIFIDCPPSLDLIAVNCLTAADAAVVISHTGLFSVNGIAQLLKTIESVRQYYNPGLSIDGIMVNQHEAETVSGKLWLATLQEAADGHKRHDGTPDPLRVLKPTIPKRAVIKDAMESGRGLDQWGSADAAGLSSIYDAHLAALTKAAG